MGVVPLRMSKLAGRAAEDDRARPRLASWQMTMPPRLSATCWTRVPESVTSEVAPVRPMEMSSLGMPARAESMRLWVVRWLHLRGGEGQASKMASGLAASSAALPRTATSMSRIGLKDSTRNRPGDERLGRAQEPEIEPVGVGDREGDVRADEGRALEVQVPEGLDEVVEPDEVPGHGLPLGLAWRDPGSRRRRSPGRNGSRRRRRRIPSSPRGRTSG